MDVIKLLKRLEKITIDNSPTILTAIGITGTLTTAYFAGKASFKAAELIREEDDRMKHDHPEFESTFKERVKFVWKLYLPAASTGLLTVSAIFAANHVSSRRAAGMAAAYSISERAFSEYRDKVVEKIGEQKEQAYRDEIAKDRVHKNPVDDNTVIITDNGEVLCYDHFTGRYFKSSMEALRQAENEINSMILHDDYASLSDFYELVGVPPTAFSDEVGWNNDYKLKIRYSTVLSPDNRPCIAIDFDLRPSRNFSYYAEG